MAKNCEILEIPGYSCRRAQGGEMLGNVRVTQNYERGGYGVPLDTAITERDTTNSDFEAMVQKKRGEVKEDGPLWRLDGQMGHWYDRTAVLGIDTDFEIVEVVSPTTYGTHAAFQGKTDVDKRYRANPLSQNAVGVTSDGYLTLSLRGKGADRSGKTAFIGIGFLKRYPNEQPEQVGTAVLREIVEEMRFPQLDMDRILGEIGDNPLITKMEHLERALAGGYDEKTLEEKLDRAQRKVIEDYHNVLTYEVIDWGGARFLGLAYDKVNGDTTNAVYVPFNVGISEISPANTETTEMKPLKLTRKNLGEFEKNNPECINHTYADLELLLGQLEYLSL